MEIYTTAACPHCKAAKALLAEKGVPFIEYDVERDAEAMKVMLARGGGRRTVPQIFVGRTHVGGADDLRAMDAAGRLDTLLAQGAR
nr:glutaredoxin 3 [Acuticoccus sediminis]